MSGNAEDLNEVPITKTLQLRGLLLEWEVIPLVDARGFAQKHLQPDDKDVVNGWVIRETPGSGPWIFIPEGTRIGSVKKYLNVDDVVSLEEARSRLRTFEQTGNRRTIGARALRSLIKLHQVVVGMIEGARREVGPVRPIELEEMLTNCWTCRFCVSDERPGWKEDGAHGCLKCTDPLVDPAVQQAAEDWFHSTDYDTKTVMPPKTATGCPVWGWKEKGA